MAPIDDVKEDRSSLKRKITILSTRIGKVVQKDPESSQLQVTYEELEKVYIDFACADEEFGQLLQDNEGLSEQHAVVNGMDPKEYTASVEQVYGDAKKVYQENYIKVEEEKQSKTQRLLVKKIQAGIKLYRTQIRMITRRNTGEGQQDVMELEEDKEELEDLIRQLREFTLGLEEETGGDLSVEKNGVEELLVESLELKRTININLRKEAATAGSIGGSDVHVSENSVTAASTTAVTTVTSSQGAPTVTSAQETLTVASSQDTSSGMSSSVAPSMTHAASTTHAVMGETSTTSMFSPQVSSQVQPASSTIPTSSLQNLLGTQGHVYAISRRPNSSLSNLLGQSSAAGQLPTYMSHQGLPIQTSASQVTHPISSQYYSHPTLSMSSLGAASNQVLPSISSQYHPYPALPVSSMGAASSQVPPASSSQYYPQSTVSMYGPGIPSSIVPTSPAPFSMFGGQQQHYPGAASQVPEIKMKRMELPKFSGDHKDWSTFKVLWRKLAFPACKYDQQALAKELRLSLTDDPLRRVESISIIAPNAFDLMWARISQYYDDVSISVRAALNNIQGLKAVKEDDNRGLNSFINQVEQCYFQLSNLEQLGCISMCEVDKLRELLPLTVKKEWNRVYATLPVDHQLHPFPAFVAFLDDERTIISRDVEPEVNLKKKRETSSHHTGGNSQNQNYTGRNSQNQNHTGGNSQNQRKFGSAMGPVKRCAVHKSDQAQHTTEQCAAFKRLSQPERLAALKEAGACFRCLLHHNRGQCKMRDPCGRCNKRGHHTLLCRTDLPTSIGNDAATSTPHLPHIVTTSSGHTRSDHSVGIYAIFKVPVLKSKKFATVFADDGSDGSYITRDAARRLGARKLGNYILLITTTGGKEVEVESDLFEVDLVTKSGSTITVTLFSLEKITGRLSLLDMEVIAALFPHYDVIKLQRPSTTVDILIGTDLFGLHPKKELMSAGEHLSIMEGMLGACLQGSHPQVKAENSMHSNSVKVLKAVVSPMKTLTCHRTSVHPLLSKPINERCYVKTQSCLTRAESEEVDKYIHGEELGTQVTPKCGSCRCGKCPVPGHTFSFKEEAELKLIRDNLKYDKESQCWRTKYPWRKDPLSLPNNKFAVQSTLRHLESKLRKNDELATVYNEQIMDMISRGVAREVSQEELQNYDGPSFYISHLGVPNPRSSSTPYRIVFNSSQVYKGVSLNSYLYKGPDAYLNNQLGVLLRWREEKVGVIGDIRKMYNSIYLELEEQHCHRFLWGNLESPTKLYVMTRVNMGDKPAGAISTEALYSTANKFSEDHPLAARMLKVGSYVDDLADSVDGEDEAQDLTQGAEKMLLKGGFVIKYWIRSGDHIVENEGITQILGISWRPEDDQIICHAAVNFSPKKHGIYTQPDLKDSEVPRCLPNKLTKRMVLAQVMRIYDPFGFLSPFTLQGKLLLRKTWENHLGWDEEIPVGLKEEWIAFFTILYDVNKLQFPRVLKPDNYQGDPTIIIFSDASSLAYGVAVYIRWKCEDNSYWNRLIMAKNRVSPLIKRTTPQLELNGAVLSKRAREVITKEMRYEFDVQQVLHIVDSETVLSMLHKTSTRFKLYEGVRVGEIQAATGGDISSWAWIAGKLNISDCLTRGRDPEDLGPGSDWFNGPDFMNLPVDDWGLKFNTQQEDASSEQVNELHLECHAAEHQEQEPEEMIQYENYSDYRKLLRVLARVLNMFNKKSFAGGIDSLTPSTLEKAEMLVIKDVQRSIQSECLRKDRQGRSGGKYHNLKPTLLNDVWVVGSRLQFNPMVPENHPQVLLPTKHTVTKLMMMQAHRNTAHRSRDPTLARFREKYWITQGSKIASSIISGCQLCKIKKPKMLNQRMGDLPDVRSKPSPPFTYVAVDYFGPFAVRGDIQKRVTGKAWGVMFVDLVCRAVFIEGVFDYSTSSFLLALGKFAACRGYPRIMHSDPGSNLVGASRELRDEWQRMWKDDKERIITESAEKGMEWKFSSADSPWQNGAVEALIKSCKTAITTSMKDRRVSPFEFSAVMYDISNILNERPLGTLTGHDSELSIITPNSLLLGRSRAKNPGGWEPSSSGKFLERYHLVQEISSCFWKQWMQTVAPALVTDSKWHTGSRNLQRGDIVLVVRESAIKGEFRLARVKDTFPDTHGVVRKVTICYKNYRVGESLVEYHGARDTECTRSVQRLALVVPVESA